MEPMRALTVTSRSEPAKSMSPMTVLASSLRGWTSMTLSAASTMMLRLGLTSRVIMESTAASLGTVLGSTILPVTPGSAAEP